MELHTRQSLEATHFLPATSTAVGRSLLQDVTGLLRSSAAFVFAAIASVRRHYNAQRDYEHLLEQPDYLIFDVGLTREAVEAARYGRLPGGDQAVEVSGGTPMHPKTAREHSW